MIKKEGKRAKIKIFPQNSRGQLTIFIILAILIIVFGILIYLYYPKIIARINPETENPSIFIQDCLEEQIEDNLEIISSQGGNFVVNSNSGYFYKKLQEDEARYVRYLCYTEQNFAPCINQEAFLTEHVESEILNSISTNITDCFASLEKSYVNKGYTVKLTRGIPTTNIVSNAVSTNLNTTLTLTKGDEVNTYRTFEINLNSNMYDLLEIAKNILIWEMNVGDSIPEAYMYNNPYIRVEKHKKDNDVKIYVLTDLNTEEDFRFAVRSYAAPVGFA